MSIKVKIVSANLLVFGLILVAFAYLVYSRVRDSELAKIDSYMEVYAARLSIEIEDQWEDRGSTQWSEVLAIAPENLIDVRFALQDTLGNVVFAKGDMPRADQNLLLRAIAGSVIRETRRFAGHHLRHLVIPVAIDGHLAFILRLAASTGEFHNRLESLMLVLGAAIPLTLLLTALAVYLVTRLAFSPVTRMVDVAEKISGANLDRRLELPTSNDEVKRLAEAFNRMMDRIENAFKSQRQFVADASHELRTPLTVVYSELEFLQRRLTDPQSQAGIEAALAEIDRLARLVDQLLLLARIDASKLVLSLQSTRLDELLAESVRRLSKLSEGLGVRLMLHIEEAIETTGDPERLESVFLNLIDNAVKYTPEGGTVAVSLSTSSHNSDVAIIEVKDTGIGIAAEELPLVTKRFYRSATVRGSGQGSGLGLAIAKELVELHGGVLRIQSHVGQGTTVTVELAACRDDSVPGVLKPS